MGDKEIVGLVCARAGSKRLPNKNSLEILGEPLYYRACKTLAEEIEQVYLLTDIQDSIWPDTVQRPEELNGDSVPLQDVAKWFLSEKEYKQCALLMPTNPMIDSDHVREALSLVEGGCKIVRSYGVDGEENGLYVFDVDYFLNNKYQYDVYTGAISAPGIEIHTQKDYEEVGKYYKENKKGV
jgi:hypothetical protein